MGAILSKYIPELIFGLISAGLLWFCRYLWSQNKELKKMQQADQNRQYRQMILDEIEPIINELRRLKDELVDVENHVDSEIQKIEQHSKDEHNQMYKDLHQIQNTNINNFNLIIDSYKFRLIQLCRTHLRDNYITETDFEQISEMYRLYHGLGGNGQAQEYYEKVLQLEIRPE